MAKILPFQRLLEKPIKLRCACCGDESIQWVSVFNPVLRALIEDKDGFMVPDPIDDMMSGVFYSSKCYETWQND